MITLVGLMLSGIVCGLIVAGIIVTYDWIVRSRTNGSDDVVDLKFKFLNPIARLPQYAHDDDSGMDVSSAEYCVIKARSFRKIGTGLAAVIPKGYEIQIRPRSGMQCKKGIVGAWGTVDSGYRGEIGVTLYNHTNQDYVINKGDRIAQMVLAPVVHANIGETTVLDSTERGNGGFGSTGV